MSTETTICTFVVYLDMAIERQDWAQIQSATNRVRSMGSGSKPSCGGAARCSVSSFSECLLSLARHGPLILAAETASCHAGRKSDASLGWVRPFVARSMKGRNGPIATDSASVNYVDFELDSAIYGLSDKVRICSNSCHSDPCDRFCMHSGRQSQLAF